MASLAEIHRRSTWRDLIEGQPQHAAILAFMLAGVAWLLTGAVGTGQFLGLDSLQWAWTAVWLVVAHQVIVALGFRLQLHRGFFSNRFAERDLRIWGMIFLPLLIARPIAVLIVATLDRGSLEWPMELCIGLGLLLFTPAVYAIYSVVRYFGIGRAIGGDHFRDDIREMPLVKQGIFRWTDNGMYAFAFLGLWSIAILLGSWQALVVAAFQHAYIWVHMYTVEGPDMRQLHED